MAKHKVITARFIVEIGNENDERTISYVVTALKNAFRHVRDGNVLTSIYDDQDNLIGVDMSGTPSLDMQDTFDDLVDKYEARLPPVVTAKPTPPRSSQ